MLRSNCAYVRVWSKFAKTANENELALNNCIIHEDAWVKGKRHMRNDNVQANVLCSEVAALTNRLEYVSPSTEIATA